MVDPEGYAFYSTGLDCVNPGENCRVSGIEALFEWLPERNGDYSDAWSSEQLMGRAEYYNFAISNLIHAFGKDWWDKWAKVTKRRLIEWGFNTVGNWSSLEFARKTKHPYVWPLKDFPQTKKTIFRDFPDVFSDEYSEKAETFAEQLQEFASDPYLIGYFLRNEPQWAFISDLNIAEELLENELELASKDALIQFLYKRYEGCIEKFNQAWGLHLGGFNELKKNIKKASELSNFSKDDLECFSKILIERYVRIPCEAVKKVDPHHLNLGMRYAFISNENLLAGCENFDVFSINCYKMNPAEEIRKVGEMTKMPVMIGEYHFGALDRGMLTNALKGVLNQQERGKAYSYYTEHAAAEKWCIGTHYFILNDQALLGRFDGENAQIGCVDVCHTPYTEFIEGVIETHRNIYEITAHKKLPTDIQAAEVENNLF